MIRFYIVDTIHTFTGIYGKTKRYSVTDIFFEANFYLHGRILHRTVVEYRESIPCITDHDHLPQTFHFVVD